MSNVTIIGAAGRMGQTLIRAISDERVSGLTLTGAYERSDSPALGQDAAVYAGKPALNVPITADMADALKNSHVAIDFTFHAASVLNATHFVEHKIPWVIGTTGFSAEELTVIHKAAESIPVFLTPNMSLGVSLLAKLVEEAARALARQGYDCEIIERHHRHKKDAPSGTAIFLGEAAANGFQQDLNRVARHGRVGITGERTPDEIGFHAIRGGDIVGDHTVLFATDGEMLELSHRATSRDTFALGALRAAQWLMGCEAPGMYNMRDVLALS